MAAAVVAAARRRQLQHPLGQACSAPGGDAVDVDVDTGGAVGAGGGGDGVGGEHSVHSSKPGGDAPKELEVVAWRTFGGWVAPSPRASQDGGNCAAALVEAACAVEEAALASAPAGVVPADERNCSQCRTYSIPCQ